VNVGGDLRVWCELELRFVNLFQKVQGTFQVGQQARVCHD
jgi:hypothetical protein